jgi:hypothetical protein
MIQSIVIGMITVVMLGEYVVSGLALPNVFKLVPEILSLVTAFIVVFAGVRDRFQFVAAKYWLVFAFAAFVMLSGIVINQVGTGPTVAGMRMYLRAIPFFFLPAVFQFTDEQIKQQLKVLLVLGFLQVPIAGLQRWIVYSEGRWTGDEVIGTLQISSILSIFLISSVLLLVGLRLRNHIDKSTFLLSGILLLIPTMINETKGTLVLLPIGLLVALSIGVRRGQRIRVAAVALALFVGFGGVFIPVYDFFMRNASFDASIVEFFTDEEKLGKYLAKEGAGVGATDAESVGRGDAIRISVEYMSREPIRFAFGLGLGSVSNSSLGESFAGPYRHLFQYIATMSFSVFLLEIGSLGVAAVFSLYWLVFWDSIAVARNDEGLHGAFAIGWGGVTVVIVLATVYKSIHVFESLSYLFWYFSGLMSARRLQMST